MTRTGKAKESDLDAEIRITLSESVQKHQEKKTKGLLLEDLGVIAICLGMDLEPDEWIKDSGYTKHMIGNRNLFSSYKAYNGDVKSAFLNERLDVWELVDKPFKKNVIEMKWLWKNKKDEYNAVIRNKARLVAKGYRQEEGIHFEESFAPVARLSTNPHEVSFLTNLSKAYRLALQGGKTDLSILKEDHPHGTLSTSGEIQFLGDKIVSWSSKKQDCTTISTAEAENPNLGTVVEYQKASLASLYVSCLDKQHFKLEDQLRRFFHESNPNEVGNLRRNLLRSSEVSLMATYSYSSLKVTSLASNFKERNGLKLKLGKLKTFSQH
ncbi:retrovirus-related pol polyprotein from transposon TNT 1-94 [Tanacetum coccineum]